MTNNLRKRALCRISSRQSRLFYSIKYNSKERRYNGEESCAIFNSLTLYVFNSLTLYVFNSLTLYVFNSLTLYVFNSLTLYVFNGIYVQTH